MNLIKGAGIKLEFINTEAQRDRLRDFASSFGHVAENFRFPVVALKENGKWFGYAQIYNGPSVFSAWHTDPLVCSPRQVIEGFKLLSGWAKVQHGGGLCAVPEDTKTFLPGIMEKLGFSDMKVKLYECSSD